ncbi:hypothetical protein EW146_g5560 [Bondarzewia mesenterica]|uniref:aldehyde dehydrogenase (NAD(+)) n=1 Tax=Bondarzewia mesenterica TaxID=1095465 RepID=A0A4S4LR37_9AGAM|nr:hypothetical protein EW146_g5560 [Bondarzewia mesenterica]
MFLLARNRIGTLQGALLTRRRLLSSRATAVLSALDIPTTGQQLDGVYDGEWKGSGDILESVCPTTGEVLAQVKSASPKELHDALARTREAYTEFRNVPAPVRGEIVRQIREALAAKREELGALVSLEMGKIRTEGVGEVQEFVDICDYATVPNPLGVVGVLSAFNFPVAVYGWNLSISMAAGNATIWKPSPSTSLCSIAVTKIIAGVLEKNGIPGAVAGLATGGKDVGEAVVESTDVDMVSFTGSEAVGRSVGKVVQLRFGKALLELGGNNASIIMPDADLSLALPAVFFGAVGTAGQRCTTTRRLYLHRDIAPDFLSRLQSLYSTIRVGDPLESRTLLGPLHTQASVEIYHNAIAELRDADSEILTGGRRFTDAPLDRGLFVQPTIAVPKSTDHTRSIWSTERFAPILKVAVFDALEQAIEWNNAVPQGLSSSLWTRDLRNVGKWIGPAGSDAGIVNVNVGTSGAEIGAAFGGNKSTGWGRESGGDAWKQYVRWSTCTINYSDAAPLAQGVNFTA